MRRLNRRDVNSVIISSTAIGCPLKTAVSNYLRQYAADDGKTARAKRYDCGYFLSFMDDRYLGASALLDVNASSVNAFLAFRLKLGEAPSTVARRFATVRHFSRAMASMFKDFDDPCIQIKGPRVNKPPPKSLTREEATAIRAVAHDIGRSTFAKLRNHALIETCFLLGLRCFETCLLNEGQLSGNLDQIKDVQGKGSTFYTLPIPTTMRPLLRRYLDLRDEVVCAFDPYHRDCGEQRRGFYPLFVSVYGARRGDPDSFRMSEKTVWNVFHEAGERCGVHMHPHRARHTFVKQFYEMTGDIVLTREAARHTQLETTLRYAQSHAEELRRAFEKMK